MVEEMLGRVVDGTVCDSAILRFQCQGATAEAETMGGWGDGLAGSWRESTQLWSGHWGAASHGVLPLYLSRLGRPMPSFQFASICKGRHGSADCPSLCAFIQRKRTPYWSVLVKSRRSISTGPSVASLRACARTCLACSMPNGRCSETRMEVRVGRVETWHWHNGGEILGSCNFQWKNRRAFAVNSRIVRKCSPIEQILVPLREMLAESGRSRSRPGQCRSVSRLDNSRLRPYGGESAPGRANLAEKKEEREDVAGVLSLCQSQELPFDMACFDYLVGFCA